MDIKKYTRVAFYVEAVQVTPENLGEVADWCGGEVRTFTTMANGVTKSTSFIKVHVKRPLTPRQTKAFVGDWVLYAGTGFKVYTPAAFEKCFVEVPSDKETRKYPDTQDDLLASLAKMTNVPYFEEPK